MIDFTKLESTLNAAWEPGSFQHDLLEDFLATALSEIAKLKAFTCIDHGIVIPFRHLVDLKDLNADSLKWDLILLRANGGSKAFVPTAIGMKTLDHFLTHCRRSEALESISGSRSGKMHVLVERYGDGQIVWVAADRGYAPKSLIQDQIWPMKPEESHADSPTFGLCVVLKRKTLLQKDELSLFRLCLVSFLALYIRDKHDVLERELDAHAAIEEVVPTRSVVWELQQQTDPLTTAESLREAERNCSIVYNRSAMEHAQRYLLLADRLEFATGEAASQPEGVSVLDETAVAVAERLRQLANEQIAVAGWAHIAATGVVENTRFCHPMNLHDVVCQGLCRAFDDFLLGYVSPRDELCHCYRDSRGKWFLPLVLSSVTNSTLQAIDISGSLEAVSLNERIELRRRSDGSNHLKVCRDFPWRQQLPGGLYGVDPSLLVVALGELFLNALKYGIPRTVGGGKKLHELVINCTIDEANRVLLLKLSHEDVGASMTIEPAGGLYRVQHGLLTNYRFFNAIGRNRKGLTNSLAPKKSSQWRDWFVQIPYRVSGPLEHA